MGPLPSLTGGGFGLCAADVIATGAGRASATATGATQGWVSFRSRCSGTGEDWTAGDDTADVTGAAGAGIGGFAATGEEGVLDTSAMGLPSSARPFFLGSVPVSRNSSLAASRELRFGFLELMSEIQSFEKRD